MSEYISFSQIDPDYAEEDGWTPEQLEAAEFFHKMDWEGGIDGLYGYGGADQFPVEIREFAAAYGKAHENLHKAITAWGHARGVEY